MNIARFQVSLNHDDPDVVRGGLDGFREQILIDHDVIDAFGYYGRSNTGIEEFISQPVVPHVRGALAAYIRSSPRAEELFVLWLLPERDRDKDLCASHMHCISAILFCSCSENSFANALVNRILNDFMKSIYSQLSSGNTQLVHSTLGLLTIMGRSSPQNCRDTYQKLYLGSPTFVNLVQKGKPVLWVTSDGEKLSTDSRLMIILLVLVIMKSADESICTELLAHSSILKRILNAVHKDVANTIELTLGGLSLVLRDSCWDSKHAIVSVVDSRLQQNLISLYSSPDISIQDHVHIFLRLFAEYLSEVLFAEGPRRDGQARHAATSLVCNALGHADLRHRELQMIILKAQPSLIGRCVSVVNLPWGEADASFKFMCALGHLTHLCDNCDTDPLLRSAIKQAASAKGVKSDGAIKKVLDDVMQSMIPAGLTKKDFTKILLHPNLLLQRMGLVYWRAVLRRVARLLGEAGIGSHSGRAKLEPFLNSMCHKHLPDFQLCVTLWSRYMRCLSDDSAAASASPAAPTSTTASTSMAVDDSAEGGELVGLKVIPSTEQVTDATLSSYADVMAEKVAYMATLLLQVIEGFISIAPSCTSTFDLLRLLDDLISAQSSEAASEANDATPENESQQAAGNHGGAQGSRVSNSARSLWQGSHTAGIVSGTLRVLRSATSMQMCRWFGSQEDTAKLLTNIIVLPNWRASIKQSPLAKLMSISAMFIPEVMGAASSDRLPLPVTGIEGHQHISDKEADIGSQHEAQAQVEPQEEEGNSAAMDTEVQYDDNTATKLLLTIRSQAKQILRNILQQSGMFLGHGAVDAELSGELHSWLSSLTVGGDSSIPVIDVLLRLSFHWNVQYSTSSDAALRRCGAIDYVTSLGPTYVSAVPSEARHVLPFSPVLFCALAMACSNFDALVENLPKHIRNRLHPERTAGTAVIAAGTDVIVAAPEIDVIGASSPTAASGAETFFDKYERGFRSSVQTLVIHLILSTGLSARNRSKYSEAISAAVKVLVGTASTASLDTFVANISSIQQLLSCDIALANAGLPAASTSKKMKVGTPKKGNREVAVVTPGGIESTLSGLGPLLAIRSDISQPFVDSLQNMLAHILADSTNRAARIGLVADSSAPQPKKRKAGVAAGVSGIPHVLDPDSPKVEFEFTSDSCLLMSPGLLSLVVAHLDALCSLEEQLLAASSGAANMPSNLSGFLQYFVQPHWLDLATLRLSLEGSYAVAGLSFFRWCERQLNLELQTFDDSSHAISASGAGNEQQALLSRGTDHRTAQLIRSLQLLKIMYTREDVAERNTLSSCLVAFIEQLIRALGLTGTVASVLLSGLAQEDMDIIVADTLAGKCCRQILHAAALVHYRKVSQRTAENRKGGGSGNMQSSLWSHVSRVLEVHTTAFAAEQDLSFFSLGWLVQKFVDSPNLRRMYVAAMLDREDNYALLNVQPTSNHDIERAGTKAAPVTSHSDHHVVCNGVEANAVDPITISILMSASIQKLEDVYLSVQRGAIVSEGHTIEGSLGGSVLASVVVGLNESNHSIGFLADPFSILSVNRMKGPPNDTRVSKGPQLMLPQLTAVKVLSASHLQPYFAGRIPVSLSCLHRFSHRYLRVLPFSEVAATLSRPWHCALSLSPVDESSRIMFETLLTAQRDDVLSAYEGKQAVLPAANFTLMAALVASCGLQPMHVNLLITTSSLPITSRIALYNSLFPLVLLQASLPIIVASGDPTEGSALLQAWMATADAFVDHLFEAMRGCVSEDAVQQDELLGWMLHLQELLRLRFSTKKKKLNSRTGAVVDFIDTIACKRKEYKKKTNKWIKSMLKSCLGNHSVMNALSTTLLSLWDDGKAEGTFWHRVFQPDPGDFFHPEVILQMLAGHSRFHPVVRARDTGASSSNDLRASDALVHLVLMLVGQLQDSSAGNESLVTSCKFIAAILLNMYTGTLSVVDRLVARILHILNRRKICPPLWTAQLQMQASTVPYSTFFARLSAADSDSVSSTWITSHIKPAVTYSTLGQFPIWRTLIPQPLQAEGPAQERLHRREMAELYSQYQCEWTRDPTSSWERDGAVASDKEKMKEKEQEHGKQQHGKEANRARMDDNDSNEGSDQEDDSSSEVSDHKREGDDSDEDFEADDDCGGGIVASSNEALVGAGDADLVFVDRGEAGSEKVYDPSFWLPCLHYNLQNRELSVRLLANAGMLSLVINSLSCKCALVRTYAVSCLQQIFSHARKQTPDRDAAFRERPQLCLLLSFIRNAIPFDGQDSQRAEFGEEAREFPNSAVALPATTSLFLARAAMHLLQATHELYAKTNKYLLSRPFCDPKDVPLYDLLVVDGDDDDSSSSLRLNVLRLVRDGLTSHQDHLNLCRKNAYNRLMLLFPLLSRDLRSGHAILDLLDKAMGLRVAARYLIERCDIITWLQQMGSVPNSLCVDTTERIGSRELNVDKSSSLRALEDDDNGGDNDDGDTMMAVESTTVDGVKQDGGLSHSSHQRDDKKGRGQVGQRLTSKLVLAASPRLLTHVLVLLRRVLGAAYLLCSEGAGSIGAVQRIFDVVTYFVDELIAVYDCGKIQAVPVEYLRQLLLSMWDVHLIYSMLINQSERHVASVLGVERIYRFAAILASVGSGGGTGAGGGGGGGGGTLDNGNDASLSVTLLLGFSHRSAIPCDVSDSSKVDSGAVLSSLWNTSLRHILPLKSASKNRNDVVDGLRVVALTPRSGITALPDGAGHSLVKSTSGRDHDDGLLSVLNILDGASDSGEDIPSSEFGADMQMQAIFQQAWTTLTVLSLEDSSLPTAMGAQPLVSLAAAAALRLLSTDCASIGTSLSSLPTTDAQSLVAVRWSLTMFALFERFAGAAFKGGGEGRGGKFARRCLQQRDSVKIMSVIDQGPTARYTSDFCSFQLLVRLCLVGLVSTLRAKWTFCIDPQLYSALYECVQCLLMRSAVYQPASVITRDEVLGDLCVMLRSARDTVGSFDGSLLWEADQVHTSTTSPLRALTEELCITALAVISTAVTLHDRSDASNPLQSSDVEVRTVRSQDSDRTGKLTGSGSRSGAEGSEGEGDSKRTQLEVREKCDGLTNGSQALQRLCAVFQAALLAKGGRRQEVHMTSSREVNGEVSAATAAAAWPDEVFEAVASSQFSQAEIKSCVLFSDTRAAQWRGSHMAGRRLILQAMKKERQPSSASSARGGSLLVGGVDMNDLAAVDKSMEVDGVAEVVDE